MWWNSWSQLQQLLKCNYFVSSYYYSQGGVILWVSCKSQWPIFESFTTHHRMGTYQLNSDLDITSFNMLYDDNADNKSCIWVTFQSQQWYAELFYLDETFFEPPDWFCNKNKHMEKHLSYIIEKSGKSLDSCLRLLALLSC